jgi:hypothetical protein
MMRATNDVMMALLPQRQSRRVVRRFADGLSNQLCGIDFLTFNCRSCFLGRQSI